MFVDHDPRAIALITLERRAVWRDRACYHPQRTWTSGAAVDALFDLIVLDPPYDMNPHGALTPLAPHLAAEGVLVLEHARRQGATRRGRAHPRA